MQRRRAHLSPRALMLWRDGVGHDPKVAAHIETCETCRWALAEVRLLRHQLRSSRGASAGAHASGRELEAYFDALYLDGELPPPRRREIEAHLDGCAHCLERLLDLRAALMPSADLRARIVERLSTGAGSAGRFRVAIQAVGGELIMAIDPAPAAALACDALPARRAPVPDKDVQASPPSPATMHRAERSTRPLRASRHLSWGGADVTLECLVEPGKARLAVTVTGQHSGESRARVPLSLWGQASGALDAAWTDCRGRASFALAWKEPVSLSIGTQPPLQLDFDFD